MVSFRGWPGNGLGHFLGAFPHGIVNDQRFPLSLVLTPVAVGVNDILDMGTPDHTMVRGNHVDVKVHFRHLGKEFFDERRKEGKDVGVIFGGLLHEYGKVHLIVKAFAGSQVLAKSIAGDQ